MALAVYVGDKLVAAEAERTRALARTDLRCRREERPFELMLATQARQNGRRFIQNLLYWLRQRERLPSTSCLVRPQAEPAPPTMM